MSKEQEQVLIKNILEGDTKAYEVLMDAHKQFVFSLVLGILRNREEAEEVTMDVFVKAYQKLDSFHFNSKFSTWLYTIAYREALMHLRKRKETTDELPTHLEDDSNLLNVIHQGEQRLIIEKALVSLNKEESALIAMYYMDELNLKEISEITSISPDTLKVKIHRTRKKLAQILIAQVSNEELNSLL